MALSEASESELRLFHRLNQYVEQNHVELLEFWQSTRLCLTFQQFLELLQKSGFRISIDEINHFRKESVQFINLETLLKNVEYWLKSQISISNFISKQEKKRQNDQRSRAKTNHEKYDLRMDTKSSGFTIGKRGLERQITKQIKLNETLIKAKNQSDYELTIKVGEVNDICNQLKNDCSFIIDSGYNQLVIREIKAKTGQQAVLSKKIFEKRYQELKAATFNIAEGREGTLEEDLRRTLVEVMYLSGALEEQIKLLEAKGITH